MWTSTDATECEGTSFGCYIPTSLKTESASHLQDKKWLHLLIHTRTLVLRKSVSHFKTNLFTGRETKSKVPVVTLIDLLLKQNENLPHGLGFLPRTAQAFQSQPGPSKPRRGQASFVSSALEHSGGNVPCLRLRDLVEPKVYIAVFLLKEGILLSVSTEACWLQPVLEQTSG
ncbi:hypothetical protein H8959_013951 [Pygathrix nigripes]